MLANKRRRFCPAAFRSIWIWIALFLALATTLAVALLPYGIAYGIQRALISAGLRTVELVDVDFNPFSGHLKIHGLKAAADGREVLSIPAANVHLDWWPLWQRRIHIESATVHDLFLTLTLDEKGSLQLAGIPLPTTKAAPGAWGFGLTKLQLDGRLDYSVAGLRGTLHIDRALLTRFSSDAAPAHLDAGARLEDGSLHVLADLAPFAAAPVARGEIKLTRIPLSAFAATASLYAGKLDGKLGGRLAFEASLPSDSSAGRLVSISGELAADKVYIGAIRGTLHDLSAKKIEATGIRAAGLSDLGAERISATSLALGAPGDKKIRMRTVNATGMHVGEKEGFAADRLEVAGAEAWLHRDARGHWRLGDIVLTAKETKGMAPSLRLGKFVVADSRLHVRDETVAPPFASLLSIHQASLSALDSAQAENPIPFSLDARVDKFATLTLTGEMQPFATPPMLKSRGRITQLSLPTFSAYAVKELGYQLKTGQMDADFEVNVAQGRLGGTSKLVLRRLQIGPENPDLMQQLTGKLSMSLDGALDLLRDSNGDISLNLPISGDLTNPKFDYSDAFNQAMGQALQQAAIGYLKYALQPYGTFIAGAQLALEAGKKALVVRVDPVVFAAGAADLEMEPVAPYLQRLADVLSQRPGLRLRLCGQAVLADGPARGLDSELSTRAKQESVLLELARQRAKTVKEALIQRHSVASERLFVCLPEIDAKPDALPRVDVLLD